MVLWALCCTVVCSDAECQAWQLLLACVAKVQLSGLAHARVPSM